MLNEILFWLLPTGWLCSLAQYWLHRRKTTTDDLLQMVQDLKKEMLNVQRENIKLYGAVRELSAIIALAGGCSYYNVCPINHKLQQSQTGVAEFGKSGHYEPATPEGVNPVSSMEPPEPCS